MSVLAANRTTARILAFVAVSSCSAAGCAASGGSGASFAEDGGAVTEGGPGDADAATHDAQSDATGGTDAGSDAASSNDATPEAASSADAGSDAPAPSSDAGPPSSPDAGDADTGSTCTAGASCTPANPCDTGVTSCNGNVVTCDDTGTPAADGTPCGASLVCTAGTCGCAAGWSTCGSSTCVDLTSDHDDCNVCNSACSSKDACINGSCSIPPQLPVSLENFAAVLGPDGQVYVLGGDDTPCNALGSCNAIAPLDTVYVYSPTTNTWGTAPPMPTARTYLAAAVGADGRIYALGGTGAGGATLSTVEAYDVTTKTWSAGPSMLVGRTQLGAAVGGDGRIYAIEGMSATSNAPTLSVEALNTSTQIWSSVASPGIVGTVQDNEYDVPEYLPVMATGGNDGRVYAFINGLCVLKGAYEDCGTSALTIYDPSSGAWTPASPTWLAQGYVVSSATATSDGDLLVENCYYENDPNPGVCSNVVFDEATLEPITPAIAQVPATNDIGQIVGGLPHGRILAMGGSGFVAPQELGAAVSDVYLYDPTTGAWVGQ